MEHAAHVRDAGGVEAQRLVERQCVLPRESKEGHTCEARYAGRQAGGGGRPRCKQRAGEGSTADLGQGTGGEERTENMPAMSVTLEVLKLSGWLNDDAPCRESNGGYAVWVMVGTCKACLQIQGKQDRGRCTGSALLKAGGHRARGSHGRGLTESSGGTELALTTPKTSTEGCGGGHARIRP